MGADLARAISRRTQVVPTSRNSLQIVGLPERRASAGNVGPSLVPRGLADQSRQIWKGDAVLAQSAVALIQGKWKIEILALMRRGPIRLGRLRKLIPRASKKMLVQQLHELEKQGIIMRSDLSGKTKHVEYKPSVPLGTAVLDLIQVLADWGKTAAVNSREAQN